jgi:hypothetical protein
VGRRRTLAALASLAALTAALALGGCGSKLDTSKLEAEIKKGLATRTGIGIKSVSCPEEVEVKEGDKFRCTALSVNGDRAPIEVTQVDDAGSVRWRVAPGRR